jgi:hypothetical protein
MLPAKLFAVLAIVFFVCAGLAWLHPLHSGLFIGVHATYFAFGPILVLLFCAVTSANFAVLYYAAARIFHAQWNRTLSVLHFSLLVCFGISSVVFLMSTPGANATDVGEALPWLVIPWILGILSLVASLAVFAVNLTLTIVQIVRARFAIH